MLTSMLRQSPPESLAAPAPTDESMNGITLQHPRSTSKISSHVEPASTSAGPCDGISETTPLLSPGSHRSRSPEDLGDLESLKPRPRRSLSIGAEAVKKIRHVASVMNPKSWNKKSIWERGVMDPIRCLPAVIVGLLLNILDALSYGE